MSVAIRWTGGMDAIILSLRGRGEPWDRIATELGLSAPTVLSRGRKIGARKGDPAAVTAEIPPTELDRVFYPTLEPLPAHCALARHILAEAKPC